MAISPDGNWVAFQLRRADPETNRYCLGMVVKSLDGGGARLVDTGGEFMLAPAGVATVPTTAIGIAAIVTPRWPPDGRWLSFLKRVDETDRVWRVHIATALNSAITQEGHDLSDFRILNEGRIDV